MSPATEMVVRGPGVFLVITLAFALSYLLLLFRHRLAGSLLVIGTLYLVQEPAALILPLLLFVFGFWMVRKITSVIARAISGRPVEYAYRKGKRRMLPMARAEVAAEFAEWNKMVEEAVALLKRITAFEGSGDRQFNRLSLDVSELRNALVGEERRIKMLVLSFEDPREQLRHDRMFEAARRLEHELWYASVNPTAYPRHEPHGGWDIAMEGDELVVQPLKRKQSSNEGMGAEENTERFPLRGVLDIEYVDSKGQRTERYVEAKSLEARGGKLYLWAWCEIRQAVRNFRVDRIAALSNGETGEVVEPADIPVWLRERAKMDKIRRAA